MNTKIITLKKLLKSGKMIAFTKGNRNIKLENLSKKKESFEKFGTNLVPLMYVDGQKVVNDGCTLVHPLTEEDISNKEANKYVVIVEGQHRYMAAKEMNLDEEKLYLYECYSDKNVKEISPSPQLKQILLQTPWNGLDYANGAALFNPQNEFANFAKELANLGYPISVIGYIACFTPYRLGETNV